MKKLTELLLSVGAADAAAVSISECKIINPRLLSRLGFEPQSVIMGIMPYYTAHCDGERIVSAYAVAPDYHLAQKELAERFLAKAQKLYPDFRFALYGDHSPIAEVEAAAGKSLPELVELYTGMTDCEDAEKYAVICTKNALLLHTLLINAVKGCASAEELTSYKERIEGSKAKEISTPVIKQIDSKIKSINLSGNLNDAKEKLVGSAKDIFGKAKGLFKK